MNVDRILAAKGRAVATISPAETLSAAASSLSARRIGALVVVDSGGGVAGILSERDVVRAVAATGGTALGDAVSAYMTERVVTCRGDTAVDDLLAVMTSGKFRHLPVVEGGRLAGIVSIGDVVKLRLETMEAEQSALKDYIAAG